MAIAADNLNIGACIVTYDEVDLGATLGGVTVSAEYATAEMKADQFGDSPIDAVVSGKTFSVKVPLAEVLKKETWKAAFPNARLVEKATAKAIVFEHAVGNKLSTLAKELVLHPVAAGASDKSFDFTFPVAVAKGSSEIKLDPSGQQVLEVEFMILPDTSVTPARYVIHGDPAVLVP